MPGFLGNPPNCRPECVISSDCPRNQACNNQKCIDPCSGTCGWKALCQVVNHNPVCSCPSGFTGDPFFRCEFISKNHYLLFSKKISNKFLIYITFIYFDSCETITGRHVRFLSMWSQFHIPNDQRQTVLCLFARFYRFPAKL